MQQAIELVSATCAATGRNEACHGYFRVEAKGRTGDSSLIFNVGDIIPVTELSALTTSPMNPAAGEWGVALLRLQANLPDMLPGQNATFLLLGDTRIEAEDSSPQAQPLQIFRLETGLTGVRCSEGPADGLLVQTPQDVQRVKLTVNGVTIEAAGTAFVQAQPGKTMIVSAIDGFIEVILGGQRQMLPPGTQVEIPMDEQLNPAGAISAPVSVQLSTVVGLPIALLPRSVSAVDAPVLDVSLSGGATYTPVRTPAASSSTAVSVLATPAQIVRVTPTPAVQEMPSPLNDFNFQSALLTFSVVTIVTLLVVLLLVIIALIVRTIIRQLRAGND